ncbi:hypothetical protein [Plebeiibacterium sediminum]|uniref:RES domain-containing protein n=1 Tax=Plebeiibacterium sediminum TaxID=2992112 RepID=A0AAE3SG95_9BACT|nr:hypothetical protein [Plebeiobacterium sediminum]MCW3788248.1 hypothetical protein [Plebeiobacterium sediminum]
MNSPKYIYDSILQAINIKYFTIPTKQASDSYFPDYIANLLYEYRDYYSFNLDKIVDAIVPFKEGTKSLILPKIKDLTNAIINTVELYFKGKVSEASSSFFDVLDKLLFSDIGITTTIEKGTTFYRARSGNGTHFNKKDLFHIDFKHRNVVSTNRYSIPGFPALYLGDTTYVCWEEFDRYRLRDLWFTKVINEEKLNVLQIHRIEDLFVELEHISEDYRVTYLLRYLVTFPLILACTVKVLNTKGSFKPEYIIPQLLLEYVSKKDEIDGVKFPSTKVNYSRLEGVKAYNYVFPVREISKDGYCSHLQQKFSLSEPSSLELEEILRNPNSAPIIMGGDLPDRLEKIELVKGQKTYYSYTSFGNIEKCLEEKEVSSL